MKTTIFTNPVAIRAVCARAIVIALALIWWGQAAPLVAQSDAFIAAQSTQQGNVRTAAFARLTCAALVEQALFEVEKDAWIGADPPSGDASALSALDSVAPHAALAIPERRLQARQVWLPSADWLLGHGARGAFSHPLARAPPLMSL